MTITTEEYNYELSGIITDAFSECYIKDSSFEDFEEAVREYIHETFDGHQWVIYDSYHLDIFKICRCDYGDAIDEGLVDANEAIKSGGLNKLNMQLAYWCMYKDAEDLMSEQAQDYFDTRQEEDQE
jgi:hypothetical protein